VESLENALKRISNDDSESEASCHWGTWGTCPPDSMATLVNSLQNRVNSITLCITLNVNSGKIVLVTLCIQIEWLFYNVYKWLGRKTKKKQESVQTAFTITRALTKTTYCTCKAKKWRGTTKKISGASRLTCASIPLLNSFQCHWMGLRRHHRYHHRLVHKTVSKTFSQPDNGFITTGQAD